MSRIYNDIADIVLEGGLEVTFNDILVQNSLTTPLLAGHRIVGSGEFVMTEGDQLIQGEKNFNNLKIGNVTLQSNSLVPQTIQLPLVTSTNITAVYIPVTIINSSGAIIPNFTSSLVNVVNNKLVFQFTATFVIHFYGACTASGSEFQWSLDNFSSVIYTTEPIQGITHDTGTCYHMTAGQELSFRVVGGGVYSGTNQYIVVRFLF